MIDNLKQIINAAIQAPSGDNSQPWEFVISGNVIELYNNPDKDNPVFNFKQRGSLIAHGAAIENILISAFSFGYRTNLEILPDQDNSNFIARIKFEQAESKSPHPLYEAIFKRATNRKPYSLDLLTIDQKEQLIKLAETFNGLSLFLAEQADQKLVLGHASSIAEQTMLTYKPLHNYFFHSVRWNQAEQDYHRSGLFIKTMELAAPQKLVFKLLSFWPFAKFAQRMKLPRFIASENAKVYAQSSAIGIIVAQNDSPEQFILTGRLLQQIWLTITSWGFSLQPIAGSLYLNQRLEENSIEGLSFSQQQGIIKAVANIKKIYGNPSGIITMMFRVGKGEEPSARSSRKDPILKEK